MKMRRTAAVLILALASALQVGHADSPNKIFSTPIQLPTEQGPLLADEGFIVVKENRSKPGSRDILVNYLRFRSRGETGREPLFVLPGGPGDLLDRRDFAKKHYPHSWIRETLYRNTAHRDVVVLNQRGNFWALGNAGGFEAPRPAPVPGNDETREQITERWKQSIEQTFKTLSAGGVDLAGYDIFNMVADLEELRTALGYGKVIISGVSFGSQWGLSYIRVHPENVSRAMFSGVEPIDYGYDSPQALFGVLERIAASAEKSPIAAQLPKGGLIAAVKTILARLEKTPATVEVKDPATGKNVTVTVRADDFRALLFSPWRGKALRDAPAMWPKFVTEVFNGDYRYVAARKLQGLFPFNGNVNLPLIDHSLGITDARDARLKKEPAVGIIGDPNSFYRSWAAVTPTKEVDDSFRNFYPIAVPTLLVQGDMDWSTPLDNALDLGKHLQSGAVVTVRTGTHIVGYELQEFQPALSEKIAAFIDLDTPGSPDAAALLKTFPTEVSMPLQFEAPQSAALYERL
ncbi:alpha/beta hydrolase [Steroidobacter sp.]|uniref:alpha/beta hydrolase n=1 Tax=Steroidobacter sp. TaxID=1978227 RepID=UPI001A39B7E0|nr:alpha/beta hydrolase [Steroidobacter sp.]MBL8269226.1 alpha/beta hydrolase [Steroidobacter sp.]